MTDKETRADLEQANSDLEDNVAKLKELVMDKVEAVEKPFEWLRENAWKVCLGVGAVIVLSQLLRRDELG